MSNQLCPVQTAKSIVENFKRSLVIKDNLMHTYAWHKSELDLKRLVDTTRRELVEISGVPELLASLNKLEQPLFVIHNKCLVLVAEDKIAIFKDSN